MRSFAALVAALLVLPAAAQAGTMKAGVAEVDASWHVGASAGQYATGCPDGLEDGDVSCFSSTSFAGNHGVDPTTHSTRRAPSYGIQSRLTVRALVVEGPGGNRFAVVKNDLYIPQDMLWRRVAQLTNAAGTGISQSNLVMAVSHNHSSPYYSGVNWGVWTFQDVFDVRFYEYYARQMAAAVKQAADGLKPVKVGASVSYFDETHRHSFGGAVADDGTPAGYPTDDADHDMTVIRFDELSGKPLAVLVNFALHPEFLDGNDLISADYVGPLERMVDRESGAKMFFTQHAVGTAEPERSTYHSIHDRFEFTHREYGQAEYGARRMADSILRTWQDVADGAADPVWGDPQRFVPFQTDFSNQEVAFQDRWFPGPLAHPYPGVSNCNTAAFPPRIPVAGLPTCQSLPSPPFTVPISEQTYQQFGIPVPSSFSVPSYAALEEDVDVHLQAFRIGDILFTVCSCEQWADQSRNIKTRTDTLAGNQYNGYDWTRTSQNYTYNFGREPPRRACEQQPDGKWRCPNPGNPNNPAVDLQNIDDALIKRMRAQVNNDASGWNDPAYLPFAESEPADPTQIKGNFTHDDTASNAEHGYRLTVAMSMANDYNGYIASYREYRRGDHYRKSLTAWGPHSSDYMATRLVGMGRNLRGGPAVPDEPLTAKAQADTANNDLRVTGLGAIASSHVAAYEANLPDDGGTAQPVAQPKNIERFDTAFFTWNGGSNFTDNPVVKVQRWNATTNAWEDFADQTGELPVTLKYPQGEDVPAYTQGDQQWHWTAHFEAFVSRYELGGERPRATPPGHYRFVVDGQRRQNRQKVPYHVESSFFQVGPWSGITVDDMQTSSPVSFKVGPRHTVPVPGTPAMNAELGPIDYPDTYTHAERARFIQLNRTAVRDPAAPTDPNRVEWYCLECSFRPWLDVGNAATAKVTILKADGSLAQEPATYNSATDRWVTAYSLQANEAAIVGAGCVQDSWGNFNAAPSGIVGAPPSDPEELAKLTGASCPVANAGPGPPAPPPGGGGPGGTPPGGTAGNQPGGSAGAGPPAAGGSRPSCIDRTQPYTYIWRYSILIRRSFVQMTGRSFDRGCRFPGQLSIARDGRVRRVDVSLALLVRGGCRFLGSNGRLGRRRSCGLPVFLPARLLSTRNGYTGWTFRKATSGLPRGPYRILTRGTDASRNLERYPHPGRLVSRRLR